MIWYLIRFWRSQIRDTTLHIRCWSWLPPIFSAFHLCTRLFYEGVSNSRLSAIDGLISHVRCWSVFSPPSPVPTSPQTGVRDMCGCGRKSNRKHAHVFGNSFLFGWSDVQSCLCAFQISGFMEFCSWSCFCLCGLTSQWYFAFLLPCTRNPEPFWKGSRNKVCCCYRCTSSVVCGPTSHRCCTFAYHPYPSVSWDVMWKCTQLLIPCCLDD